jgi:phage tail protein X
MIQYRCIDGDRIDTICSDHYGHLNGSVEAVLAANPGLADNSSPVFYTGFIIYLPTITPVTTVTNNTIKLWD